MKLNVFIVKGKVLILIFLSFLIVLIISLLLLIKSSNTYNETIPTMSKPQFEEYLKNDLNGDGKDDLLYITCKNDTYYIESHINNNTYFLNTKGTLGNYTPSWPLSVKLIDVNKDLIPEIITQGSFDGNSITHMFIWDDSGYKDILCSKANFIGVFNSFSNIPTILLSSIYDHSNNFYTIEGNVLTDASLDGLSSLILNTTTKLTDYIEGSNNLNTLELFSNTISKDEKSNFYDLKKDNYKYTLQDCFLEEITLADSTKYLLNLNFRRYYENNPEQIKFTISLAKEEDALLITSFKTN